MERKTFFINERAAKREAERFLRENNLQAWIRTVYGGKKYPDGRLERGAWAYLHPCDGSEPFAL